MNDIRMCDFKSCAGYRAFPIVVDEKGVGMHAPCRALHTGKPVETNDYREVDASYYTPRHMEGEAKHTTEPNKEYIPILRAGSELDDPVLVGRATPYQGQPGVWIFEILPESMLNEFITLGELKCFSISATVGNFDMDAMHEFWERDKEETSKITKNYVPEHRLQSLSPEGSEDQVFEAIRFTGKNGKEVRDFLRDKTPLKTRAGNGWVQLGGETFRAGEWFLIGEESGFLMVQDDSGIKQYFKRVTPKDPTRYVRKEV